MSRRLRMRVDVRSKVPAYRQIVDQVRAAVTSGTLEPGDQMPTVRVLASEIGIHFNTVARAYRQLDRAGIISTQRGRGSYIVDRLPASRPGLVVLNHLSRDHVAAATGLGFTPDQMRRALERSLGRSWREGKSRR